MEGAINFRLNQPHVMEGWSVVAGSQHEEAYCHEEIILFTSFY